MARTQGLTLLLALLPALAGGAFHQLERDQPLWRHPGLWNPSPPPAVAPALPRLVLAVHYPWYGAPGGPTRRFRHWNHARVVSPSGRVVGLHDPRRAASADRRDIGAAHYPPDGPYDSRDPTLIVAQLAAARAAGLDGLVVSWWGRESLEAVTFVELLRAARDSGLRLAPYYETGELWRRGPGGVPADLEALADLARGESAWLRVDGRPVVFLYASHRLRPRAWQAVERRLHAGRRSLFLVGDVSRPARPGRPDVPGRFQALHAYDTPITALLAGADLVAAHRARLSRARLAGVPFVASVAPGYDDRAVRVPGQALPRRGGATYDLTWEAALAVDPAWVLVVSWNEWHEGTEIEPSREHGGAYLEATRRWAERFRGHPAPVPG